MNNNTNILPQKVENETSQRDLINRNRRKAATKQNAAKTENDALLPETYIISGDPGGEKLLRIIKEADEEKGIPAKVAFVCNYIPHIETIYYNERENQTLWTIRWEENGQVKRLKMIPKDTFSTSRKITELYEKGFSVTSANANEMVKYFQQYEAMHQEDIETKLAYSQLGRIKGGFLLPNQFISADNRQDIFLHAMNEDKEFLSGFEEKGTSREWLENVFEPLKDKKIILFHILASLGSPLLNVFHVETGITDLSGATTIGKTFTLNVGASVWGNYKKLVSSWKASFAGIERRAILLNHFPLMLDDTKKARVKKEELTDMIYALHDSLETLRSGLKTNHDQRTWNCFVMSTGERKITNFSNAQGQSGRVVSIHGAPLEHNPELVRKIEKNIRQFHGSIGVDFLKWFVHLPIEKINKYEILLEEIEKFYQSKTDNHIIQRTAKYMAFIKLIAEMLADASGIKINTKLLDEVWIDMIEEDQEDHRADIPFHALKQVIELFERNENRFYTKNNTPQIEAFGEYHADLERLCYYPEKLKEYLDQKGYDTSTILKQWKERKYILSRKNESKNTFPIKSIKTNKIKRMCVIDLQYVESLEAE